MDKIKRVFSGSGQDVAILKEILEDNGIPSIIKNEFNAGLTAGFGGGLSSVNDLYVKESDVEGAIIIIDEFKASSKE